MFREKLSLVFFSVVLLSSLSGVNQLLAQGLDKFSDWSEPVNLGRAVNSEFDEATPAISPNQRSLYFRSNRPGGFGNQDIWVSQRVSPHEPWREPQNLGPNINTSGFQGGPEFSPDGHWLYFASDRPGGCGGQDLWVSYRKNTEDDFGWEPPENLGCILNTEANEGAPSYFEDKETGIVTLYFDRVPGALGDLDIYASTLRADGSFGRAALVWELSSPQRDAGPAIRKSDGLEMFISSDRPGTLGDFDLWVSTRETTRDAWSSPRNLGPQVNSTANDLQPVLSFDGTALYFDSDRPGGMGGRDLYVSTRKRLQE